jgi:hypothetical protein
VLTKGAADHIVRLYAMIRNEEQEGDKKKVRVVHRPAVVADLT